MALAEFASGIIPLSHRKRSVLILLADLSGTLAMTATPKSSSKASGRLGQGVFVLLMALGGLLFLGVVALIPQIGPVLRIDYVASTSMEPNYRIQSFAVVNRAAYGYSAESFDFVRLPLVGRWPDLKPERGDVVLFRLSDPKGGRPVNYIKRVIGVAGDKVELTGDVLTINGVAIPRAVAGKYAYRSDPGQAVQDATMLRETLPGGATFLHIETDGAKAFLANTGVVEVPAGHLFLMGDNRDNSVDSRLSRDKNGAGLVPVTQVVGKIIGSFGGNDR